MKTTTLRTADTERRSTADTERRSIAGLESRLAVRLAHLLNRIIPDDCRIRTAADYHETIAVIIACFGLMYPPLFAVTAWCVWQAKKGGGE